ncbi:hypothetical protein KAH43_03700, partial [Candidatus Bipolaricaulota bacterium]|nr:hypothetical protein [Candidatus Bipolaricaulota bacterium]
TIGTNEITFRVQAHQELETGWLEIAGDTVVIDLFDTTDVKTGVCTIPVHALTSDYSRFCFDNHGPIVTITPSRQPNGNGWYRDAVTLTFRAEDEVRGSGIDAITYRFDIPGNDPVELDQTDLVLEGNGRVGSYDLLLRHDDVYPIVAWAVDGVGNESEHKSLTIRLDTRAPSIAGRRLTPANQHGWNNGPVSVTFDCADGSGSAVSGIDRCPGQVSVSGEGEGQLAQGEAVDRAGNRATDSISGINIDKTVPTVSVSLSRSGSSSSQLTITATDGLSGIDSVTASDSNLGHISLSRSGDRWQGTIHPAENGIVSVTVVDRAGNERYATEAYEVAPSETPSQLEVSVTSLEFGDVDVGSSSSKIFTITNRGQATLEGAIGCSSSDCGAFSLSSSSFNLGENQRKNIRAEFHPNYAPEYAATLEIESNGGSASIRLTGSRAPNSPGPHAGGDLIIGVSQTFKDLDSRISNSTYDSYVLNVIFDGLIILHPETLEPSPWIAKSWDILSDSQVRFYLNEGITFHNGEDLTADDVAFTFNWIADVANNSPNATELIWMEEAIVIDDYTVDIISKPEYTPFAPGFGIETQSIVPMDTVLAMGDDAFNRAPIGSGPFVFVEWLPGEHIKVERNEDYWLVYPNLDTITYRPIPELSVMMLELDFGGIHIADNMPAPDVSRFMTMDTVDVLQVGGLSYFHMFFNLQSPISSDIRFRKACYMSVDMELAVFSIFQGLTGVKAYGCIPPELWANDQ